MVLEKPRTVRVRVRNAIMIRADRLVVFLFVLFIVVTDLDCKVLEK